MSKPQKVPGTVRDERYQVPDSGGPAPRGGWGLFTGGMAVWMGVVLMSHLHDLGIKDPFRVLGSFYDLSRYRGVESAWSLAKTMAGHLWHVLAALLVTAGALGWGLMALRLPRVRWPGRALRPLLGLGIGFALLGLAMLGGGLAGLWYGVWPLALSLLGVRWLRTERAAVRALVPWGPGAWDIWPLAGLAIGTVLLWIAVALSPEVFYDSLVYHLADPQNWVKQHKVAALPYNFFSNFPFTFEMLFAIGVLWGHDAIAKLVHVAISLGAAGVIGWTAAWLTGEREQEGRAAGWIAGLIYLTTPLIGSMAWITGIDAGLVLYETATILCFVFWWQQYPSFPSPPASGGEGRPEGEVGKLAAGSPLTPKAPSPHGGEGKEGQGVNWLILSALFSGLGMGVKYTLGMTTGLLGLGIAFRMAAPNERVALRAWLIAIGVLLLPVTLTNLKEVRDLAGIGAAARPLLSVWIAAAAVLMAATMRAWGWRASLGGVALAVAFGLVAAVFVAPWNAKAWLFTRNPVFPFAFGAFDSFHVSPPRMEYQMGEFREFRFRPLLEWIFHPWYITKIAGFSNNSACGGFFLAVLPACLLFRGVPVAVRLLGVILLGRYLLWSNVSNIVRYFAPGLALLGALGGAMLGGWCARRALARTVGVAAVTAFSLVNIFGLLIVAQSSVSFLGVVCGLEGERDSLLRERPSYPCTPYAACEALNRLAPRGAGALYMGEARGAFFQGRVVAATVFDFPVLTEVCHAARTEADVTRKLRQLGLTHVLFNGSEGQRISGYHIVEWLTPRDRALFERWWAGHLRLLWTGGWQAVYAIVPGGAGERTAQIQFVQLGHVEYQVLQDLDQRASRAIQEARFADAIAAATELVRRAPEAARSHEVLGQACAYAGKAAQAVAAFRRAAGLGLMTSQVHYNTALMLRQLGREAEAVKEFGLAREMDLKYTGSGG